MRTRSWRRRDVLVLGAGAAAAVAAAPAIRAATSRAGGTTATQVPETVVQAPSAVRFDLAGQARSLLWGRTIQPGTMIQSFGFDDARGHLYVLQVLAEEGAPEAGRLRLTRTDLNGTVLGSMVLRDTGARGWGHGTAFAVESGPEDVRLWVEVDSPVLRSGESHGRALARIPFTDGATLKPSSTVIERHRLVSGATVVSCAIDPENGRLVQRYVSSGRPRYAVYELTDVIARRYQPVAWFCEPVFTRPGQSWAEVQGFTVHGRYLYALVAGSDGRTHISTVDLRGGRVVQQREVAVGPPFVFQKPEGMAVQRPSDGSARLCYGYAGGGRGARTTTVMYLDDLA